MTANAKNLSKLANVLDSGSNGQFLQSTGSGGIVFADVAAGASVYDSAELLPLSGNDAGAMAYVTGTNRFYINNGSGWYSISLVNTNPNITSVQDASAGTTPFTLTTDGTATVITITANDPEDVPLTYGYSVTAGSLTNGGGTTATVAQSDNVFTVTPSTTEAYAGTFSLTFTASDGINTATSANSFTLNFITTITNSKYTTLLATATGTSDNNNITYIDGSGNSQNVTVNGDAHAGTFSPYRSGGYSMYFNSSYLKYAEGSTSNFNMGTNAFTIEAWVRPTTVSGSEGQIYHNRFSGSGNGKGKLYIQAANLRADYRGDDGLNYELRIDNVFTADTWSHICLLRDTSDNKLKLYHNGTLGQSLSVPSTVGILNSNSNTGVGGIGGQDFPGDISNLRVVNGTAIVPSLGGPTEALTSVTNTKLLLNGPNFSDYSGNAPQINNYYGPPQIKAYGPLDYEEYDAADNGGSVYFDTSDDYLTVPNGSWKTYGSSNFTIECWFYADRDGMLWGDSSTSGLGDNCTVIAELKEFNGANAWVQVEFRVGSTKYGINPAQGTFKRNAWNHIAFVRNGNAFTVYSNGKDVGNTSQSGSMNTSSNDWAIASAWPSATGSQFNGYISDFRVSKSARYTAEFTPPTAPLSSTGAELHLKGTDASIIDKSQSANLKLVGNTTGSTTQVKFSNTKSMAFDGTGDYLSTLSSDLLRMGTGNFTVECWVNKSIANHKGIWQISSTAGGLQSTNYGQTLALGFQTGLWQIYAGGGSAGINGPSFSLSTNTWYHTAVVRNSGTTKLYIDGTEEISISDSHDYTSTYMVIGGYYSTSYLHHGYIQDLRVTKGLARYTANFTPPTASLEG
jgi:hypothetical protein